MPLCISVMSGIYQFKGYREFGVSVQDCKGEAGTMSSMIEVCAPPESGISDRLDRNATAS